MGRATGQSGQKTAGLLSARSTRVNININEKSQDRYRDMRV
jgi:hypothetical protein